MRRTAEELRRIGRLALLCTLLLSSCRFGDRDVGSVGRADSVTTAGEVVVIEPGGTQPFVYTSVDSIAFDLDSDGVPERIRLLATVERNERGDFLWEDGHHWAVQLEDDSRTYTLVERFVPNGRVDLYALVEEPARPVVLVQTRSGMGCGGAEGNIGLSIERFSFDSAQQTYVREARLGAAGLGTCRGMPGP